jgi:hypothetical protein
MKKLFFTILILLLIQSVYAQISIYVCNETGKIGYSVNATNDNFQRDNAAESDCRNNGGSNPRLETSMNGYGCYAIVKGNREGGGWAFGAASGGGRSVQQCINDAKWNATSRGAIGNTLYVVYQGCLNAPTQNNTSTNTNSTTPKEVPWSNWKNINSTECDFSIGYRSKKIERYQFNYQLWFYYEVKNTSDKSISFTFSLTKNGKVEFSQPHQLDPGGIGEFMHKMSGDYIDGVRVTKLVDTKTNKSVCDDSKNNSNNSSPTNSNVSSDFQSILEEHNDLCKELSSIVSTSNPSNIYVNLCQNPSTLNWEETNTNKQTLKAQNTQLKNEIKRLGGAKQQQDDSQKQEQERQKKETDRVVQKTSNFTDLINDGDAKFNEGKYNDAISKYTQAKNLYTGNILPQEEAYAKDAIPLANARIAQAEKALKDAARKERVDKAYEADKKEDIAFASAAAGAIGIMAFLKDQFSYRQTFLKIQVGLGMEGLPLITNTDILGKSQTDLSIHPGFFFGFKLGLMNKLPVNIHITPYFQYGLNALKKGVKGGHINGGVTGTLLASWKNTGIFKLFFESSYYYRAGSYTYDVDAVNGSSSATDEVRTGDYSYSAYNFGGGFMIDIIKEKSKGNMQTYIKPGVYFEKALFYPKGIPYTLVAKLEVNIVSQIVLQVEYCHYYHIGGTVNYRDNFESKNRPYFGVRIIRNGNLIPLVPKKFRYKK